MVNFYLDASALGKRYAPEVGTPRMNHVFSRVAPDRMFALNVGVAEVASILVRKKNLGLMTDQAVNRALAGLEAEVIHAADFTKFEVLNAMIPLAIPYISLHSVNSTDALVLLSALELAKQLRSDGHDLVLVTSDHRLLNAAGAEGLVTFDPATQSQADLDALIGP